MRSVLIIIGIALAAVALSIALKPSKDLTPDPAMRAEEKRQADERRDREAQAKNTAVVKEEPFSPPREGVITAVLTVAGRGDVTIEMYPKAAPVTVEHVASLIKKGFYNGIKIHRVEPEFVVQAGDPQTKTTGIDAPGIGSGGSGKNVPFETNTLKHVPGTVAMALSAPRSDTGDSQFFINLSANHPLDGDYCVFGKVTQGMDVVSKIQRGDTIEKFVIK